MWGWFKSKKESIVEKCDEPVMSDAVNPEYYQNELTNTLVHVAKNNPKKLTRKIPGYETFIIGEYTIRINIHADGRVIEQVHVHNGGFYVDLSKSNQSKLFDAFAEYRRKLIDSDMKEMMEK